MTVTLARRSAKVSKPKSKLALPSSGGAQRQRATPVDYCTQVVPEALQGCVRYFPQWLAADRADVMLSELMQHLSLERGRIFVYGKWHDEARRTALYSKGTALANYTYSGKSMTAQSCPQCITDLFLMVEQKLGMEFNVVLCNLYEDGKDMAGWHSDDEKNLGPNICSVSFGGSRKFCLRPHKGKQAGRALPNQAVHRFVLGHGDLFLMHGQCQQLYQHTVPRELRIKEARLSLTFRQLQTAV